MKKKDNDFFEDDTADIPETKTAVKTTKETTISSNVGEYYGKNVIYTYKDGANCTVVYNSKDPNFITRQMG
jgi:heptaprenylglyceryl phosphate synthase